MAKMEEFSNEMCKCKDKACADKVQEGMTKWSTDMAAKGGEKKDEKRTRRPMKKMTEIGQKYAECMTKAMTPAADAAGQRGGGGLGRGSGGCGDPAAAGGPAAGDLPAECGEYKAAIEALAEVRQAPAADARRAEAVVPSRRRRRGRLSRPRARLLSRRRGKSAADAVKQSAAACN